jgi:hypothetical protein
MSVTPEERARNFVKRWFSHESNLMRELALSELTAVIRDGERETIPGHEDSPPEPSRIQPTR